MSLDTYVYVCYPKTPDLKLNIEYYVNTHMAMVDNHGVHSSETALQDMR